MDTRSKRASSVAILVPFLLAPVLPDGTLNVGDRAHTAHMYSGIAPAAVQSGDGSSSGSATVTGVGASIAASVYSSDGTATVAGVGASTAASVYSSDGVATVSGVGASTAASVYSSSGSATATAVGEDANNVVAATAHYTIRVGASVGIIRVRADVGTIQVRPDCGEVEP